MTLSLNALFIGLTTLDLIYLAEAPPIANQKIVAVDALISAGGPATNAAIAFAQLGGRAHLLSAVGQHPLTSVIHRELQSYSVQLQDLLPSEHPPPVSSIVVSQATGERAVVSMNATRRKIDPKILSAEDIQACLREVDIVLIDGHQMDIGVAIARQAKQQGIPVAIDGGSWKAGFDTLLPWVDYAICSANFWPPGCRQESDVFSYLQQFGIAAIAITHGEHPITYRDPSTPTAQPPPSIAVPRITAVDTLGAGDIFHGAFCWAILQFPFAEALKQASAIASRSCQRFGPRPWLDSCQTFSP
jgi:sugar/nucleoside kinase (ribokinase family)